MHQIKRVFEQMYHLRHAKNKDEFKEELCKTYRLIITGKESN